jgi:hypothetical protein
MPSGLGRLLRLCPASVGAQECLTLLSAASLVRGGAQSTLKELRQRSRPAQSGARRMGIDLRE